MLKKPFKKILINPPLYFTDFALYILGRHPHLAIRYDRNRETPLHVLARKPSAFASGSRLGIWERGIYPWIHVELPNKSKCGSNSSRSQASVDNYDGPPLTGLLWLAIKLRVPGIKAVYEKKLSHMQALELVKCLCKEVMSQVESQIGDSFIISSKTLFIATEFGIVEFVAELISSYPEFIWMVDDENRSLFHIAVMHRRAKIFSLIYSIGAHKDLITSYKDRGDNNMLHLAGKLAPSYLLNVVSGPALQMQRELLWFKRMGTYGQDIPFETQFLIVEGHSGSHFGEENENGVDQSAMYTVFLPILGGDFRAVLQGNANTELEICLESGDPAVEGFEVIWFLWLLDQTHFDVITNTVKTVERHLQTFCHREKKKMPDMLNWFGWCTWDAFYTDVASEGVKQGLESLEKGGIPPKFVIIDDGWQSVGMDPTSVEAKADNSANFANRLTHIKENHKFLKDGKEGHRVDDPAMGLRHIVTEIKDQHALKYVYVWHAITGYWGGVRPVHGGRVKLARKYHQALEASILRNFPDNGIISCMSHNTNGLYSAKRTAVIRASDDFWPRDPASHTIHIASVAYNTIFLGEFMQPDWDMFHSLHPMAEYHGAARAVGGCAFYVSDKPGQHDFNLLKKLGLTWVLKIMKVDDNNWPEPDRVGRQELEIVMGNEHISFTTSKIGSLVDVQTSKDPEGLRIFYYLVQVSYLYRRCSLCDL
ncbi:hypothetical protein F0562_001522 [Nyssa sinensis]|uniref:galactinol--sucrose galactosyltransferase n=1 Tax=Nyssa sinensis TaxID=561372 RepID=A0A5J5C3I6_9ASTE|nr:hypothetical protein F0562_001522 [Nyssa sinensis]